MALQEKKIQMCNVYQFLWCIYFYLDTNITRCSSGKKYTLPSPAFRRQHQLALSYNFNACLPDITCKASAMEKLMFLRGIFKYIKLSHYNHISVLWTYKWQLYIFFWPILSDVMVYFSKVLNFKFSGSLRSLLL